MRKEYLSGWTMPAATALALLACTAAVPSATSVEATATELRCEYRADPLGIDEPQPRLSWVIESGKRGEYQRAYQVRVASSERQLSAGRGDLWDSGKVDSDQSIQVVYAGRPLLSRQRCWWQVRIWDKNGQPTKWSRPAFWEMGLLRKGDWMAQGIGLRQSWAGEATWPEARWIWYPEGNPAVSAPTGAVTYFRRFFALPTPLKIRGALMRMTADDYFELFVNGREAWRNCGKPYSCKILQEIDVAPLLQGGTNLIAVRATNHFASAGLLGQLVVEFESGPPLALQTDGSWSVSQNGPAGWNQAGHSAQRWTNALELAEPGEAPWEAANYGPMQPPVYLRKVVALPKPIRKARLYASALGVYEFYLNGQRATEDLFNPGWTDYRKRLQYHTYDITKLLRRGDNALGIVLADGWYAGFLGLGGRCQYGELPLAMAQLEIEFADGARQTLVTDPTWKAATGPLLQSDMLMGETYDARREMPGWNTPGFDDSKWRAVAARAVTNRLVAARDAAVRKTRELKPVRLTEPRPGVFVFDLGQNMVGGIRLKVRGTAGHRIMFRYGEMLNPDGTLYVGNLREARCLDQYMLRGSGDEVYTTRFTFHGFRYVELTGFPGRPRRESLAGLVLHSATPPAGDFACSDPLINQLQSNILWGQRGNFLSIPTDCPQRDERLGWTGDAQVFIRTATANMDVAGFFTKWCQDVEDAQQPDGAFTDVAPFVAARTGTAAWGDAGVICPWTVYQVYGDTRILERHYAAGGRWIDYLLRNSTNYLRPATRYGDWLSIGADTPLDLLATAYFAHSTRLMARMATVLGRAEDARKYENLFQQIKVAFNQAYVRPDGRIQGDTQTCYLMALEFDLLPAEKRPLAVRYLTEDIKAKGDHLSTGFVGVGLLMPALTCAGHVDLAYRLLNQDTFPSWLYSVKNGATTIWERWDGWTREKGFQTPWMNSFNHYSLGSVGAWLYATVGGIDLGPEQPGFKHIVIRPQPGGGLTWANAGYQSIRGRIASAWKVKQNNFLMEVTIPANTTATVFVPTADAAAVTEGGKPAGSRPGVELLRREAGTAVYRVGSGTYRFAAPTKL